ncbi:MAG: DnaJ domain-containing protein [Chloracidobacterium sp.]|uniref:DnaJ domain-containing protein n=1 Tax=Chloracidobacterium validum TaxID=2821543 RepID=A0ABX8B578_9BACT|nr:DnaJ domain-containing protein [Chloracidobacterium validum]QUW02126.1 DnaJ domain-containing protein [Chloracidobacterium validum]
MTQRLEGTCVPQLIGICYQQQLSGTLTLTQPNLVRHVYFENGSIVYAASETVSERFGERLCTLGCISPEQLARAIAETSKGKRLGACLVELGYLAATDLQAMLVGHVTYLVHSLFHWTTGEYRFQAQKIKVAGFEQSLSPVSLIFDGIRSLSDMELIRRWLGGMHRCLKPVSTKQVSLPGVTLTPEEAFVLSRLDAPLRIEDACLATPLPEERVLRALCAFAMAGIVSFADGDPSPVIEVMPSPSAPAGKTSGEIDAAHAAEICFELEEKMRVVESGGTHYQVLGINRRFTSDELKKTYRELAKKFHPDRHSQLAAFDFQVKAKLERVFIAIQQAYDVLNDEEKRRKYDLTITGNTARSTPGGNRFPTGAYPVARPTPSSPPGGQPSSFGPAPKPPAAPPPRPPVPPTLPVRPPSGDTPRPTVTPKSPPLPPKPPASASFPTPPTIKRPSTGAHPASPPIPKPPAPTPPTLKPPTPPPVTAATGATAQSNGGPPSTPPPRMPTGAYPKAPSSLPPEPPAVPASELYLKTVEYMGNGDVERAYQSIRRAVEQRPNNADYQAMLGRVLLRIPGRNKEAEKAFLTAIDLCRDPDEVPELLIELSDLYIKFGLDSRAIECLDQGLSLAPEHPELKKRRKALGAKRTMTPRAGSLRVATGRRLQSLVGKVFGLDNAKDDDST